MDSKRAPFTDEQLRNWAQLRADDAGHLARELIGYRESGDISVMKEALKIAASTFRSYHDMHMAKEPPDTYKAHKNLMMAERMERALV